MISELPDALLLKILSLLPTQKEVSKWFCQNNGSFFGCYMCQEGEILAVS